MNETSRIFSLLIKIKNYNVNRKWIQYTQRRHFSISNVREVKLVQFVYNDIPDKLRAGFVSKDGSKVIDFNRADPCIPPNMLDVLRGDICKALSYASSHVSVSATYEVPMNEITLKAPIYGMDKVLCVGLNYKDHCEHHKIKIPQVPMIFSKFSSTVIGHNDPLRIRSKVTQKVDYEVELCVVMKSKATNVNILEAYQYVLGCTIAQDISARDWQKDMNGGQFLLGKSMDTFCPIGPCIVTLDELGDPEKLSISCLVNDEEKQSSNTSQLIYKIPDIIARVSSVMTLYPGDMILTGTPAGVGVYQDPPSFLKAGDIIKSEIEKIGFLENKVEDFDTIRDDDKKTKRADDERTCR